MKKTKKTFSSLLGLISAMVFLFCTSEARPSEVTDVTKPEPTPLKRPSQVVESEIGRFEVFRDLNSRNIIVHTLKRTRKLPRKLKISIEDNKGKIHEVELNAIDPNKDMVYSSRQKFEIPSLSPQNQDLVGMKLNITF